MMGINRCFDHGGGGGEANITNLNVFYYDY
jgi:hypothetical protein